MRRSAGDDHRHDDGEDHADHRGEGPFQRADLGDDDVAEHVDLAAGQGRRGRELAEHHDRDEDRADDTPGRLSGRMMVRKMRQTLAPRSRAASIRLGSMRDSMKAIGPTMKTT